MQFTEDQIKMANDILEVYCAKCPRRRALSRPRACHIRACLKAGSSQAGFDFMVDEEKGAPRCDRLNSVYII